MQNIIGITMGDPSGIGPEIILKSLERLKSYKVLLIGSFEVFERFNKKGIPLIQVDEFNRKFPFKKGVPVISVQNLTMNDFTPAKPSDKSSSAVIRAIETGTKLALQGEIDALATGPINKAALKKIGFKYPGHTEFIKELTNSRQVVMMLAGKKLKVALATTHCAYSKVPQLLNIDDLCKVITITYKSLIEDFGINLPKLACAALNPHAGEDGIFGNEEIKIISPAVEICKNKGMNVSGPFPPDTVYYNAVKGNYDAVISMYHDQGLIPLKLLHFDSGVNVSLGLPIVRTSPDHGVAYDIAHKGEASEKSMLCAIKLANKIALNRKKLGKIWKILT